MSETQSAASGAGADVIAAVTAFITGHLGEDENAAKAATPGPWSWERTGDKDGSWAAGFVQDEDGGNLSGEIEPGTGIVIDGVCEGIDGNPADGAHISRYDPVRALRDVEWTRQLVAEILATPHSYVAGDAWFSCSQAVERPGDEPGSGCANDDRAGKPCDCGRDARAARMLGMVARRWGGWKATA